MVIRAGGDGGRVVVTGIDGDGGVVMAGTDGDGSAAGGVTDCL